MWRSRSGLVHVRARKHPRVHVRATRAHRSLEGAHLLAQVSELARQCHLALPQLLIFCLRAPNKSGHHTSSPRRKKVTRSEPPC